MFKFLKNKLKKFEKKLEEELEEELSEETTKPHDEPKEPTVQQPTSTEPVTSQPTTTQPEETPSEPPQPPVETIEPQKPAEKPPTISPKRKRAKKPPAEKQREKLTDRQLEQSIENELQRIVHTRKSIEETVKTKQKPSRGINEAKIDELLWDLEIGLLESDVAYSVIQSIKNDIKQELKHISFDRSKISEFVEQVLRNAIANVLKTNEFDFVEFVKTREKPVVIMFVGVNGTGKTLSIGKIAHFLKQNGKTCVMAAGDTFRAGAIEQLSIHADNLNVKIIKHGPGSDPAAVAYDAIEHAKAKHKDVVLLDTAGRMQTNYNLMDEMAKIKRVAKPDLIVFVGDALSGNDAVEQAKRFNEVVGIDGVILTKVDTDAKGGGALSIAYTIGKPLLFIGMGQEYKDQIAFDPEWMVENIFGKS